MSSNDLKGDAVAVFAEHRDTIVAAGAIGIVILFLLLFFGGFGAVGGLLFLGYALVWMAVLAFVLWLFYRLVTAVERIAAAQERLASARDHNATAGTVATTTESTADAAEESTADTANQRDDATETATERGETDQKSADEPDTE